MARRSKRFWLVKSDIYCTMFDVDDEPNWSTSAGWLNDSSPLLCMYVADFEYMFPTLVINPDTKALVEFEQCVGTLTIKRIYMPNINRKE